MTGLIEDADIIAGLKSGDQVVFRTLVSSFRSRVFNTCYRFLLNREDAEDVSQDVFIELFQSIRNFRGETRLSTWIYRIAVSRSLDEIKKRNRKKRIRSVGKMLGLDEVANWLAGGKKADEEIERKEQMAEMMEALNTLADNQRVAFTLSKIEGYTNPEIADIMATTTLAVESLVYRAKKKIGAELENILKK